MYDVQDPNCKVVIDDAATGRHVFLARIPEDNDIAARGAALANMKKSPDGAEAVVLDVLTELVQTPVRYKGAPLGDAQDWKGVLRDKLNYLIENLDYLLFQSVVARPGAVDLDSDCREIQVLDGLTGQTHVFIYEPPTAETRAEYRVSMLVQKDDKLVANVYPTRRKFALRLVKGFKPGTIVSGKVEMQGDAKDAKKVLKARPDIAMAISYAVFESSTQNTAHAGPDIPVVWEEPVAPLASS